MDPEPTGEVIVQVVKLEPHLRPQAARNLALSAKRQILKDAFAEPAIVSIRLKPISEEISRRAARRPLRRPGENAGPEVRRGSDRDAAVIPREGDTGSCSISLAGEICDPPPHPPAPVCRSTIRTMAVRDERT